MAPAAPVVAGRYRYLAARQVAASGETIGVARNTAKEATMTKKPNYTVFLRAPRKHGAVECGVFGSSPFARARPNEPVRPSYTRI